MLSTPALKARFFTQIDSKSTDFALDFATNPTLIFEKDKFLDFLKLLKEHFPQCFDRFGKLMPLKLQEAILDLANEQDLRGDLDKNLGDKDSNNSKESIKQATFSLSKESYNLNWLGKSYAKLMRHLPPNTLIAQDKAHNSQPQNAKSHNVLIKGDNLEVLKHLKNAYYRKIKMIYIDPPYNTGGDGFIYNDERKFTPQNLASMANIELDEAKKILDYTLKKSSTHSAWLSFMYPRLYIARQLLRDDGVIFISIDDNEQANLKILCDEIFGEENFVACFIRQTRKGGGSMSKFVSIDHDYIIMYCKDKSRANRFYASYSDKYLKRYNESDEKGRYFWDTFARNRQGSSNVYEIEMPDGSLKSGAWIYKKEKYEELKRQGEVQIKKLKDGYTIQVKQRLNTEGQIARSLILDSPNQEGTQEAVLLFGREQFTYPKPEALLKRIIEISTQENDLVMDFFAGSGTTCAVAHKMKRRWVGIEQMDYVESITKARLIKVIEGEQGGVSKAVGWNPNSPSLAEGDKGGGYKNAKDSKSAKSASAESTLPLTPSAKGGGILDLGFKIYEMRENNLDSHSGSLIDLSDDEKNALLETFRLQDSIAFSVSNQSIDLGGYSATLAGDNLYLLDKDFATKHLQLLIEKIDSDKRFVLKEISYLNNAFDSAKIRELE